MAAATLDRPAPPARIRPAGHPGTGQNQKRQVTRDRRWSPLPGGLVVAAVIGEWLSAHWDLAWHVDVGRDRFLTPPHIAIVSCAVAAGLIAVTTLLLRRGDGGGTLRGRLACRPGLVLTVTGAAMTGVALGIDNWSHSTFGVDLALFSPSHLLVIATALVALLGGIVDVAGSGACSPAWLAALAGAFLAPATTLLGEYDMGVPHYPLLWDVAGLALLFAFTIGLARRASRLRWAATVAVGTAIALRMVALGLNAALGRSLPTPPLGLLAGAVAFDLVLGRVRVHALESSSRTRLVAGVAVGWVAACGAQAAWLLLAGKIWWTWPVLLPGLVLGLYLGIAAAWAGSAVGGHLGTAASTNRIAPQSRDALTARGPVTFALVVAVVVAASGWLQYGQPPAITNAHYAFAANTMRLEVDGSHTADWVTLLGPSKPLGLFTGPPQHGIVTFLVGGAIIPPQIQGARLRALRWLPNKLASNSWLGGLTLHNGAFTGSVSGAGEYVAIGYVRGDGLWGGIVERGTSGDIALRRQPLQNTDRPARGWLAAIATALVSLLAVGVLLATAALVRRAGQPGQHAAPALDPMPGSQRPDADGRPRLSRGV
jgi:hypothetical protein